MSAKSPLAAMTDQFGAKDKLVEKLVGILESDESKEDLRKRLLGASNKKLLRLHRVATTVKEKFGSREKLLVQAVGVARAKDKDYQGRLEGFSTARLVDIAQAAERRAKRASAAAAAAPAKAPAKRKKPAKPKVKKSAPATKAADKSADKAADKAAE